MKKYIRTEEVQATEAILKGGNIYLPTDAIPKTKNRQTYSNLYLKCKAHTTNKGYSNRVAFFLFARFDLSIRDIT